MGPGHDGAGLATTQPAEPAHEAGARPARHGKHPGFCLTQDPQDPAAMMSLFTAMAFTRCIRCEFTPFGKGSGWEGAAVAGVPHSSGVGIRLRQPMGKSRAHHIPPLPIASHQGRLSPHPLSGADSYPTPRAFHFQQTIPLTPCSTPAPTSPTALPLSRALNVIKALHR